jgi:hypothetical protein
MNTVQRCGWAALAVGLAAVLAGCGTPGAPQPPSLNLPDRVLDLTATRAGDQVSLTWNAPKKNTDKLLLKSDIEAQVCRRQGAGVCEAVGGNLLLAPGAAGSFAETLPPALASGAPRELTYFVELKNRNGRSAGLSNAAVVLAGEAPAPLTGLTAEVRKDGVVLHWMPGSAAALESSRMVVRLQRKLLTPPLSKPQQGPLATPSEPLEQNMLVDSSPRTGGAPDRALDKDIRFGQAYEYRAQRVVRIVADGKTLELDGEFSPPVRVEARDVFPPSVPTGLAAVATAGENAGESAIDLSWQPGTEADLAGYAVYRREGDGNWQRISPAQPVVAPAFHDTQVQPGHTYRYAVSAIDQGGHESSRSTEAQETVPNS